MKKNKQFVDKQAHFAIRKLSIGAASVLISTSVYLGLRSNNVSATTSAENTETTELNNKMPKKSPVGNDISSNSTSDQASMLSNTVPENNETSKDEGKAPQDTTEQTITSAPVYTTQGQVPTLDIHSLFTQNQLTQDQIDTEDPNTSLTWTQQPDVSKIGNTSGIAKLSYENYDADPTTNDQGEDVYPLKNVTVNVPVLVRKAEQEVGENQVQNTLNIINSNNNSLVAHYAWVGAKSKNDDEEQTIPNSDSISEDITNILQSLGFEMDDGSDFPWNITNFGVKNKVATMFVHPSSTTPAISDTPYFTYTGGDSSIDNVNETPDPASYIGDLGTLPVGTKIEWKVSPTYNYEKDEDGNWVDAEPTNNPSISVTIPGQSPIILDGETLKEVASLPAYGDGTLLIKSNNSVQLGSKVDSPLAYVANLDQYLKSDNAPDDVQSFEKSFKWTVAPNTQQAGYTLGAFTYGDSYGSMVLFKVNPITVDNIKNITRTISFTGLPKDLIPKTVSQVVTYTQNGEQIYVDEPIAWKSDNNTWDEYVVPTVAGYTPDQTKIAAKDINLDDQDNKVVVTYTANSHNQVINYVDKSGKTIKTYDVTGKTYETVDTNVQSNVPEGWVISGKYPTQVTFGTDVTAPINVLVTKKETASGTPSTVPANKVASVVTYQTKEGQVIKTDVKEQEPGEKVEFNVPEGYVPVDKLPEVTVTSDMAPITIIVTKKETASETPSTVPADKVASVVTYQTKEGQVIKTDVKEQEPGEKVEFNVPEGYVPVDKLPEVTVTSDMAPITIIVTKKETASETPSTVPANKVASVVTYQTKEGQVIKTDVKEQEPGEKVEFNVPEGYVPTTTVPDVVATPDTGVVTVPVTKKETASLTPLVEDKPVKVVINYQDQNGKVVKTTNEDHKTGDKVKVDIPEGYVPTTTVPDVVATPNTGVVTVPVTTKESTKVSTPHTSTITNKPIKNKVVKESKSSATKVVSEHNDAVIKKTDSIKTVTPDAKITNSKVTTSVNKKNIKARRVLPKTGSKSVLAETLLGLVSVAGSVTLGFISKRKKN